MFLDLRLALRRLRSAPGFTALAVLMLGLGIGATTTVFTLINTVFLRPPAAVAEPERLVAVSTTAVPASGTPPFPISRPSGPAPPARSKSRATPSRR